MAILNPIIDLLEVILRFLNAFTHSYGLSIILLTILVRVALLPLTIKQTRSMKAMQEIQPKIKALQEKHKGDKERLNREVMSFYQENKVNPFGSCLPLILQMPIFFALFRMLNDAPYLKGESFLWMPSLAKADPYFILPVLMVASTFWSQKQITSDDPQQKQMMYMMPVFLGFIAWKLAAGILLYWVTTNIWTIAQQYVMFLTPSIKGGKAADAKAITAEVDKAEEKPKKKKSGKKPKKN